MIATNVDLADIDYLMKLWKHSSSMSKGSVGNVQQCTQSYIRRFLQRAL